MSIAEDPLALIQEAIFDRLTGDATLTALITGVFDQVPEGTDYDYVTIGQATSIPRNQHGGFGRSVTVTVHVWARARGFKSAHTIAGRVVQLLDHQDLTIAGHDVISVRYEFSQTLIDPESRSGGGGGVGDIRHIPIRFRVTTEQD